MPIDIAATIKSALTFVQAGDFRQAETLYRKILKVQPGNAYALHFLGLLYFQQKNHTLAVQYIRKSIEANPRYAEAHNNLGIVFTEMGQSEEAISFYQKAISLNPNFANAYYNLGNALKLTTRHQEAVDAYRKAIALNPAFPGAYYDLATVFHTREDYDNATYYYTQALQLNPDHADAYNNLGTVLKEKGRLDEAIECFRKALLINPGFAEALYNMGNTQMKQLRLNEAMASYRKALSVKPGYVEALTNLGNAFREMARLEEAEECYRKTLEIRPDFCASYSNLLLLMHYITRYDAKTIFTEHLRFAKLCAEPIASAIVPHTNTRQPDRRLKIGYVSPDFRRHSVAYFIEPVLSSHTREEFDVFCYGDVQSPDEVTHRLRGYAVTWRDIHGMSDEAAARIVRSDGTDILIDLAGHTDRNRLLLFARKPAPVQISWIGYPATTGLSAIDYRIVDDCTDPPGTTDQYCTEKLIRMPEGFLCYLPDGESPDIAALPVFRKGHLTFGSFNTLPKITPDVIAAWSEILRNISGSRLIVKAMHLYEKAVQQSFMTMFAKEGISENRVDLLPWSKSTKGHLSMYHEVDIALDTFPYNGTTTTCEALWMGVPVITLSGHTHASRVGVSLLSNVGLPELIAKTPREYVEIAVNLANDLRRLESLRKNLRDMIVHSPLTDSRRFVLNLEKCYRTVWGEWCAGMDLRNAES